MGRFQRRLAASVLKVGETKVWMDPNKREDISKAITRSDVRRLVQKGSVKKRKEEVPSPSKKTEPAKRGPGSKKGRKTALVERKRAWINTVRPLRRELKALKDSQDIDNAAYRRMRSLIKGGVFRSRSHLRLYLRQHGLMKKK